MQVCVEYRNTGTLSDSNASSAIPFSNASAVMFAAVSGATLDTRLALLSFAHSARSNTSVVVIVLIGLSVYRAPTLSQAVEHRNREDGNRVYFFCILKPWKHWPFNHLPHSLLALTITFVLDGIG